MNACHQQFAKRTNFVCYHPQSIIDLKQAGGKLTRGATFVQIDLSLDESAIC
jgi:hypothetical protein